MAAPVDRPSASDKVRYQVDRFLSWSPLARFMGLFALSFFVITVCAILAKLVVQPEEGQTFDLLESMWWAMTRTADAGTMGGDTGTGTRIVATLATLSGVFVVALLIGLVSSTIGDKIEDLRKGKSPVIDERHTLILGFGEKIYAVLRELREANSNQKNAVIVVLSPHEKEEVENAISERMGDMRTTRVVVRQGSPYSPHDLKKVGAGRARSIVILSSETSTDDETEAIDADQADLGAIKTLLALRRIPGALTQNHAVVELLDSSRRAVVEQLGAGGVEVVAMEETLSRVMVQTARQNGLAQVYRDLLTYEGSEFYFRNFPELAGQPYGSAQWKMKDAIVVGYRRPGNTRTDPALTVLNPKDDTVLEANDELLVIAEDDDSFSLTANHAPEVPADFRGAPPQARRTEKLLICGDSPKLGDMLQEFDNYVLEGSEAWLMPGVEKEAFTDYLKAEVGALKNLRLKYVEGDPTQPDSLKKVLAKPDFVCCLVVADTRQAPDEADARTVITVLLLRDFLRHLDDKPRIISEILDPRTKDLLEQDYGADFVVSSEMTSMLMAQVSERRELNAVFDDLFDSDGNEVYLKRAACYAPLGQPVSWMSVQKVARTRGEVAIGHMRANGKPLINPPQNDDSPYTDLCRIIVIAENDDERPVGAPAMPSTTNPEMEAVTHPAAATTAPPQPPGRSPTASGPAPVTANATGNVNAPSKPVSALLPPQPKGPEVKAVSAGPRVQGPSTQPRAPLPPVSNKPKGPV